MSDSDNGKPRIKLGIVRTASAAPDDQAVRSVPFPVDRTIRWAPRAASSLPAPDVDLVISQEVLLQVCAHVGESFDREIGGFLLGNRYRCPQRNREYVMIDQYSEAQFTEETAVSLAFTHDCWAKLAEDMDGKFNGKLLVGWYHSHPRMDVFLSAHDVPMHDQRFSENWKSALVITPDKHLGGFFCRRSGVLDSRIPVEFFEYFEGSEIKTKKTVMTWEGYDALDAVTGQKLQPVLSPKTAESRPAKPCFAANAVSEKLQPFPAERVVHWLPKGDQPLLPQAAFLLVGQSALGAIRQNVTAGGYRATGFLLGNSYQCPNTGQRYLVVDQLAAAPLAAVKENSAFTAEAWQRINEDLDGKFLGKEIVGWYQPMVSDDVFRPEQPLSPLVDDAIAVVMVDANRDRGVVLRRRSSSTPSDFYELREIGGGDISAVTWNSYRRAESAWARHR